MRSSRRAPPAAGPGRTDSAGVASRGRQAARGGPIWVAQERTVDGAAIIGSLAAAPMRTEGVPAGTLEITKVYVARAARRRGVARALMGEALNRLGWSRDSFIVSSKVFWGGSKPTQRRLSRKHVSYACHAAPKRLQGECL